MRELASVLALEVNAVLHCNLSCVGCSHASPVTPATFADAETVHADMTALAGVLRTRELRIVGGEPLLHPELPDVLVAVRKSGIEGRIRVVTNGTRLHLAGWNWLDHVDEVHVSVYPGAAIRSVAMADLERRCRGLGVQLLIKRYHSFRLVQPAQPLTRVEAQEVFDSCQVAHRWSCHTVHEGHLYLCPMSAPPGFSAPDERCALHPTDGLTERVVQLLSRREPLRTCRRCLGTVGQLVPHSQVSQRNWQERSRMGRIDREHLRRLTADPGADNECSEAELVAPPGR